VPWNGSPSVTKVR